MFCLMLACFGTPARLAFGFGEDDGNALFVCKDFWSCGGSIVDLVFMLEILINFNLSFVNRDMRYETNRCNIAQNYLFSWFIIDFIAVLPRLMTSIFAFDASDHLRVAKLIRMTRVMKMMRFLRIFKILKATDHVGGRL